MIKLQLFESDKFGQIRSIYINGKIHFIAIDVAKALGYKNTNKVINDHCRWVTKCYIPHPQNKAKTLAVNAIPEGDVYRLVVNSELPSAQEFESWVFDEVLPIIRREGKYVELETNDEVKQKIYRANVPGSEEIQRKMECIRRHMSALDVFLDTYNKRNSLERQEQLKGGAISLCFELAFHVVEMTKMPYDICVIEGEAANKSIMCKTAYGLVDVSSEIN